MRADTYAFEGGVLPVEKVPHLLQPQEIADPQPQLRAIDRLGQEFLDAGFERVEQGAPVGLGRHHNDGDTRRARVALEDLRDLVPVHPGHHQVQQDQIRLMDTHRGQRFVTAVRRDGQVPFGMQQRFEKFAILHLVVDDQDGARTGLRHVLGRQLGRPTMAVGVRQESVDGGVQLGVAERFGDVGVTSGRLALLLVRLHGQGGEGDDRDVGRGGILLQQSGRRQPVHTRKLDVHQDQVRLIAPGHGHARFRVDRAQGDVADVVEEKLGQFHDWPGCPR